MGPTTINYGQKCCKTLQVYNSFVHIVGN